MEIGHSCAAVTYYKPAHAPKAWRASRALLGEGAGEAAISVRNINVQASAQIGSRVGDGAIRGAWPMVFPLTRKV